MSEPTVTTAATVATPGHPTLDGLHEMMLTAVNDMERAKARSEESEQDAVARIFRNTNEDEVPGVTAVRDAILAIVQREMAESGNLSDEQRAEIRKTARENYKSAKTTFDNLVRLGMATPQDGYVQPQAPGSGREGATLGSRGFDSPKGLTHTATIGDKEIAGTFATLAGASKTDTAVLVNTLKGVVEDWDSIVAGESVDWAYESKNGETIRVSTTRKA